MKIKITLRAICCVESKLMISKTKHVQSFTHIATDMKLVFFLLNLTSNFVENIQLHYGVYKIFRFDHLPVLFQVFSF